MLTVTRRGKANRLRQKYILKNTKFHLHVNLNGDNKREAFLTDKEVEIFHISEDKDKAGTTLTRRKQRAVELIIETDYF